MQENTIEFLFKKYNIELEQIYENFNSSFHKSSSLCNISKYQVFSGGKRIRPLIIFVIANLLRNNINQSTINFATCVELLHNATLIHDDVIDDSDYRRSKTTLKKEFGISKAILSGDYLFAYAFDYIIELPKPLIIETQKTALKLIEGEYAELEVNLKNLSIDDSLNIMQHKTASLFSLSTFGSYILNHDNINNENNLLENDFKEFGKNIGMCFQIMDDILDISVSKEISGKPQGTDFIEKKPSIIVTLWLKEKTSLFNDFINEDKNIFNLLPDIHKEVLSLGIINKALVYFEKYYSLSIKNLNSLKIKYPNNINLLDLENYLKYIKDNALKNFS